MYVYILRTIHYTLITKYMYTAYAHTYIRCTHLTKLCVGVWLDRFTASTDIEAGAAREVRLLPVTHITYEIRHVYI